MKKSTPTPKELSKKRLAKNKIMKIPINEGKFDNKENVNPGLINNIKKKTYERHDREVKDGSVRNPFDIPNHIRVFSKRKGLRIVKPEPFIMSEPHTVCDIDSTFYKVIEARPLRQLTDVKVYMKNIRDITLFRANAAYLKDQIIQIDASFTFEMVQYKQIDYFYKHCKANFFQFAKEGYEKAKKIQENADSTALKLANMIDQLEAYSFEYVKLRNELSSSIFTLQTLTKYGKFLNSLSPICWQNKFDCLNILHSNEAGNIASTSAASINEYKMSISKFKQMEPYLYFESPIELMLIYDQLSRQCLNYMQIDVFTSNILNSVLKSRDVLKGDVTAEMNEMKELIEVYENKIKFQEEKEIKNKAVFENLLVTEFQRLYSSFDSMKLFTCIQYVNIRIFGNPEDPKDTITVLMHELENLYLKLSFELDNLDQEIVKKATKDLFSEDIKIMNRAHKAHRTGKECDILKKALYASFEPPKRKLESRIK